MREAEIISWLSARLTVPELIGYGRADNMSYMVTARAEGISAAEMVPDVSPEILIKYLCKSLKSIQSADINGCPFDLRLDNKLAEAFRRVEQGLVDEDDFDEERTGMKAADIYESLINKRPTDEDLVFSHGDFCLPNIIFNSRGEWTFIDLGRAGIADRYQDISLLLRSFQYNYGIADKKYVTALFSELYGQVMDLNKIEYYQALDELF